MGKLKKVSLIIAVVIVAVFLLTVFILFNFPYGSVIKRLDNYLLNNYSTSLSVLDIRYRFPSKFLFDDIKLARTDGSLEVDIDHVTVYLKFLNFSKVKKAGISGIGLSIKNDRMDIIRVKFSVGCGFRLSRLLKSAHPDAIDFFNLRTDGVNVEKLWLSGFEFSSFKIPVVDLSFINQNGVYVVERGLIKSNLFSSELSGGFNYQSIDGKIVLTLSNEFFQQYANFKGFVDSVAKNGIITILIKGNIKKPALKFT